MVRMMAPFMEWRSMVFVGVWEVRENTSLKKLLEMEVLVLPVGFIAFVFRAPFFMGATPWSCSAGRSDPCSDVGFHV